MQKTRLGISVGLLGAAIYFAGLFNGFLLLAILVGYVLLFEENEWLKRTGVKAVVIYVILSLLGAAIGLIPDAICMIDYLCTIFGGTFSIPVISAIVEFILQVLAIFKVVLFIILGIKALRQSTIVIPAIDSLITKYMH